MIIAYLYLAINLYVVFRLIKISKLSEKSFELFSSKNFKIPNRPSALSIQLAIACYLSPTLMKNDTYNNNTGEPEEEQLLRLQAFNS